MLVTEDCVHYLHDDFVALEITGTLTDRKEFVLIDKSDLPKVLNRSVHVIYKKGVKNLLKYAMMALGKRQRKTYLHLFLQDKKIEKGYVVDHLSDTLDNRKSQQRICTIVENTMRSPKRASWASSKYKGVSLSKGRYHAKIMVNRKNIPLGSFLNEAEAGSAYDSGAIKYFGNSAYLNFPNKFGSEMKQN